MKLIADCLVAVIALIHFWFMTLEMFLWERPIGLKTFRNKPEMAEITAALAANQGLYNGFLASGLLVSFLLEPSVTLAFQVYFLCCVIIAGIYGAYSVSHRILFIQSLPAIVALTFVYLAHSAV